MMIVDDDYVECDLHRLRKYGMTGRQARWLTTRLNIHGPSSVSRILAEEVPVDTASAKTVRQPKSSFLLLLSFY